MATRPGYLEFPIGLNTGTLAAATRYEFAAATLYIPETGSRTFRKVWIEITALDAQAATATRAILSGWTIGIKLGSAAFSDASVTTNIGGAAEQYAWRLHSEDLSAYFATNFGTGTSQTCQVAVQFETSSATNPVIACNISAKVCIQYDFDDTSQTTRSNLVKLTLDSLNANLTTSLQSFGTNQVPALDTLLEESSKTFRAIWFEIEGNEANTAAVDYQLAVALDSEAEVAFGSVEQACQSSRYVEYLWRRDDMTTSAAHDFKARITAGSAVHKQLTVTLCVVYEYNHSTSTRLSVYREHIAAFENLVYGPGATDACRTIARFWASEPGTLTLKWAAVIARVFIPTDQTILLRCGSQSYATYALPAGSATCGGITFGHRCDAGAANGAGLTLEAVGTATQLTVDVYNNTALSSSAFAAVCRVVYSCDKCDGPAKSIGSLLYGNGVATGTSGLSAVAACAMPSGYHCQSGCLDMQSCGIAAINSTFVCCERGSTEFPGAGYVTLLSTGVYSDALQGVYRLGACGDVWRANADDLRVGRLSVTASRDWRYGTFQQSFFGSHSAVWRGVISGHQFAFNVTVTNSGGGTVTLRLCDAATGEALVQTTRVGNGTATLYWGDARPCYVDAYEDGTHVGRSEPGSGTRVTS